VIPFDKLQIAQLVGSLSGFITVVSFVPQAYRAWTRGQTKDLSRSTFVLLSMQSAGWTTYGVLLEQAPIIWTNACTLVLVMVILAAKVKHG
jgi:MtN3 and saliva related transmembrane protein